LRRFGQKGKNLQGCVSNQREGFYQSVDPLSKDFLRLVGLSIVVVSPTAYWLMQKWLEDFAYRLDISTWIFVVSGIASSVIAILAVSCQSIRAALLNPAKSLKV
jgi:putative ABC transport system permease protein